MKIIKFVKKGKANYNLILENNTSLTLNEEVIIKNNLIVNKDLNDEIIKKLLYENNIEELYSKCIKFISIRLRSKTEIINYLSNKKIDKNIINIIVEKLEKAGYINDDIFAKCYINDKINLTNYGEYKIRQELKKHNIDENIINKYINDVDEDIIKEKINKIIKKSIESNTKYSKNMLISKIFMKLTALGYDRDLISNELNNYEFKDNNDIIIKDYEKILNKLENKYSGKELEYKIKQKLVQKGYNYEDINSVLSSK